MSDIKRHNSKPCHSSVILSAELFLELCKAGDRAFTVVTHDAVPDDAEVFLVESEQREQRSIRIWFRTAQRLPELITPTFTKVYKEP